jgi:hypothetical protein
LTSDNYAISYQAGTLTVNKAQLTGQVASTSIAYGDVTPALALGYTGFKNSETQSSLNLPTDCAGPSGKLHVGGYAVKCGEVSLDDYDVTVTGGTLTVTKASLTVQTDSKSIGYGSSVPSFGVKYDSFVNGDTESSLGGTLACDAPSGIVAVGDYNVTCSGLTSDDYAITYVPGHLTVSKAALVVAPHDAAMTCRPSLLM